MTTHRTHPTAAFAILAVLLGGHALAGSDPSAAVSTAALPIREVAVFKDGHAFVLHEGAVPVNDAGEVILDTVPAAILGTVWPYCAEPNARLTGVVAGTRKVQSGQTTLAELRQLLFGNPGAEVVITEQNGVSYGAVILGAPAGEQHTVAPADGGPASAPASAATSAEPSTKPEIPVAPNAVILLKVQEGTKALPVDQIRQVTFRTPPRAALPTETDRKVLTFRLDWGGKQPAATARIGLAYVQKGLRWIPNYRIDLEADGKARVRLQATLINELADLDDTTAHLVIGVPSFYFKDTLDPLALQDTAVQLSAYFQERPTGRGPGHQAAMLSNALLAQQVRMGEYRGPQGGGAPAGESPVGSDLPGAANEDLFIFTLEHLRLRKGERMVLPVAEFTLSYEDAFALELPFAPPADIQPQAASEQVRELERMLKSPKVMHRLHLTNSSQYPLTTAPVLLVRDGRPLAQALLTYTPSGGHVDIDVTAAVDISVSRSESETQRTPNALHWRGDHFARVDLAGEVQLTNRRAKPVRVRVTRHVFGRVEQASHDGRIEMSNALEDGRGWPEWQPPYWWYWYAWPYWWHYHNGHGRITWTVELDPGEAVKLEYKWYYYWR
ncbi:MAG: hypothetical protein AB1716_14215 [Planctomycetota bacterium]